MDQNMSLEDAKQAIEATKKECDALGITCKFQTANELLGEFLTEVEEVA
jgi:hypothetical protein